MMSGPACASPHHRKRTVIAYSVDAELVFSIIGIFYGRQDHEAVLQDDLEDKANNEYARISPHSGEDR